MVNNTQRFIPFDFLRGLAVLLVFFRHVELEKHLSYLGWIGVDLFFVLSGFLIARLLFQEFQVNGNIHPFRFLIRRSFKILPLYYLSYLLYVYPVFNGHPFDWLPLCADLFFFQNYVSAWGYANMVSWSLAIEEHFYLVLAIALTFLMPILKSKSIKQAIIFAVLILIAELVLRIYTNLHSFDQGKNFTMTHLRLDGLILGVLIAWLFERQPDLLLKFYQKFKIAIFIVIPFALFPFAFIDPISSFFVRTIGFSLTALSFGLLVVAFLPGNLNLICNSSNVFCLLFKAFAQLGKYSYAFYLVHVFCIHQLKMYFTSNSLHFVSSLVLSILLAMLLTHLIEKPLLKLRDRLFPSRSLIANAN